MACRGRRHPGSVSEQQRGKVISASTCTVEPSMLMLPIPQLEFASTNPATMNTRPGQVVPGEPVRQDRPPKMTVTTRPVQLRSSAHPPS